MNYYSVDEHTKPYAIAVVICFVLLIVVSVICSGVYVGYSVFFADAPDRPAELYAKSGVVTFVDRTEDRVCFTDRQGEIWEFESADDWEVDDLVACVMSDNGTDEIFDDVVINVKYEG